MASNNDTTLAKLSLDLSNAVATASAHTVAIRARRRIPSSGVVWRDGLIVAASHTVRRDGTVPVTLPGGDSIDATVVGRDPETDLIVLRSEDLTTSPAPLADDADGAVGSLVLALGRPGHSVTASFGIISAITNGWRTARGRRIDGLRRLDLAVYDGFSGGPLVSASGRVIGINNSALTRGGAAALPAGVVNQVVDAVLGSGRLRQPFLGVAVHPVALSTKVTSRLGLTAADGLLVVSVADDTPADAAGILVGDILLQMNAVALRHPTDLYDALASVGAGESASLEFVRGDERRSVPITPVDRSGEDE